VWYSHPTAATRSKGGLDEYHCAPPQRRPLAVLIEAERRVRAARGALGALAKRPMSEAPVNLHYDPEEIETWLM